MSSHSVRCLASLVKATLVDTKASAHTTITTASMRRTVCRFLCPASHLTSVGIVRWGELQHAAHAQLGARTWAVTAGARRFATSALRAKDVADCLDTRKPDSSPPASAQTVGRFLRSVLATAYDAGTPYLLEDAAWLDRLVHNAKSRVSRDASLDVYLVDTAARKRFEDLQWFALQLHNAVLLGPATDDELDFIAPPPLGRRPVGSKVEQWDAMARRLLHINAFWSQDDVRGRRAPLDRSALFSKMEVPHKFEDFHKQLTEDLTLSCRGLDTSFVNMKLEDYAKVHHYGNVTFFPTTLPFIATAGLGAALINRNVAMRELREVTLPRDFDISGSATVVALSGESGSGKTVAALYLACTSGGVAIYTTAEELGLAAAEALGPTPRLAKVMECLEAYMAAHCPVQADSERDVAILVIDELGGCPEVADTVQGGEGYL